MFWWTRRSHQTNYIILLLWCGGRGGLPKINDVIYIGPLCFLSIQVPFCIFLICKKYSWIGILINFLNFICNYYQLSIICDIKTVHMTDLCFIFTDPFFVLFYKNVILTLNKHSLLCTWRNVQLKGCEVLIWFPTNNILTRSLRGTPIVVHAPPR